MRDFVVLARKVPGLAVCMRTVIRIVRVGRYSLHHPGASFPLAVVSGGCCPKTTVFLKMVVDPLSWWLSVFPHIPPVGHLLRGDLAARWTRFHSLPGSKRYPDSELDFAELLMRHLAVAGELFTSGETIYVYRCHQGEPRLKGRSRHQIVGRQLRDGTIRFPAVERPMLNEDYYFVRALATVWKPDFFEVLTRKVARWELAGITFVSPRSGNLYCPYDGGMDVFCFSLEPSLLEERFRTWMSEHEGRL